MNIDEAVVKLTEHLHCGVGMEDEGVFVVRRDGNEIVVDVTFIHRLKEVTDLGGVFEGFPVITGNGRGRVSCW